MGSEEGGCHTVFRMRWGHLSLATCFVLDTIMLGENRAQHRALSDVLETKRLILIIWFWFLFLPVNYAGCWRGPPSHACL